VRVEVLYVGGCPGYEQLLPSVRALAAQAGVEVVLRSIETPEAAEAERFLGSPTVKVDGRDVDPGAASRNDFGLKCRLYPAAEGGAHMPPERWIRDAFARPRG